MSSIPTPETTPLIGTYYHYYFVGHGAQFRVYAVYTLADKPTGRVIKVPLDFTESKDAIWDPLKLTATYTTEEELDVLADARAREVMQFKHAMPGLVQGVLGEDTTFNQSLGNLKILQTPIPVDEQQSQPAYYLPIFFTQDYVLTLDTYLQRFRLANNKYTRTLDGRSIHMLKSIVEQIIELHYLIWQYGIFEFVFKPENFGIRFRSTGSPQLIWMDLAEHITDLNQAEKIIEEKRWLHPLMPRKIDYQFMPAILHEYYADTCDQAFTVSQLHKKWRQKSTHIEQLHAKRLRLKELTTLDSKKSVSYWVARHNLSTSLYRGFTDHSIDDLDIPVADLSILLADRNRKNPASAAFIEEKIERAIAAGDPPIIVSSPVLHLPHNENWTKQ